MIEQQTVAQPRASIMDVVKNRDFLKLWGAQITSQTTQQIVSIALVLQVSAITSSSTATAGIVICFMLAAISLFLFLPNRSTIRTGICAI
jgi:hypothetical protein